MKKRRDSILSFAVNAKTLGERIEYCMKASGMDEIILANHLGISLKQVKRFIKNKEIPTLDEKRLIADGICTGNYDWLVHGINTRGSNVSAD